MSQKKQARDVFAELGKESDFYLDSHVIIPVKRSKLINSLSSSRILGEHRFQVEVLKER